MIEYILMLIITVSLLFLASKVFDSMNKFMNSYMGDYIACLMEYGELPTMGVAEADLKNHLGGSISGCDTKFEGFTLANGKPASGGGGGGKASGSGGKSDAANRGSSKTGAKKEGSSASSDAGSSSSDSAGGGRSRSGGGKSGSNSNPYNNGQIRRSGSGGTADSGSSDEKVRTIDEEGVEEGRGRNRYGQTRQSRVPYRQDKYKAITGKLAEEIEKKTPKKAERKPTTTSLAKADNEYLFTPKKKAFLPPVEIKDTKLKDSGDDGSFQFGYFIKWLIIAGMILAIIILLGGQILNYSNSGDQ